jgi:formylmethanofuran dehydrogenase subunit A
MLAITRIERTERVARKLSAIEKDRYPELLMLAITRIERTERVARTHSPVDNELNLKTVYNELKLIEICTCTRD